MWGQWTDNRTSKDKGRVKDAVRRKLQSMGLDSHRMGRSIAKTMQLPHIRTDGRFHQPEIYTVGDVGKLDALWDMLEKPWPIAAPTDEEAVAAWRRQQGEPMDVHKCDQQARDDVR
jgi:23S rRNA C2498 (ribose-2'-O)-methylase RlmM